MRKRHEAAGKSWKWTVCVVSDTVDEGIYHILSL